MEGGAHVTIYYQLAYTPADINTLRLDLIEQVIQFIYQMLGLIRLN